MIVNEDKALRKQIDLEKEKISADLGYFADFLDYAQDEKQIGRASCRER